MEEHLRAPKRPSDVLKLFEQAGEAASQIALETHAFAVEAAQRLRETADLPSLPAGLRDVYAKLADKMVADLKTAQSITERAMTEKTNGQ